MSHRLIQDAIAVIGMGCRFPGNVNTPQDFWQLLSSGYDAVGAIPAERWDLRQYYHPDPAHAGKTHQRQGGFLQQVDRFDASFFGISAVEASRMDPQQRLLLEVSYEACENAGIPQDSVRGSATGVFIGICTQEYSHLQSDPSQVNAYTNAGGAASIAANRLSYYFDWRGPSLIVDTACSSSLVAIHLACQSLSKGECTQALAGGVSLLLDPVTSIGFSKAQMLSPGERCRSFDAQADGYVRGEGAGAILLKPLHLAQAAGDPIYAVIRATGVNQDGRTPHLHYPGQDAQEALIHEVYHTSGIDLAQVSYIEAHATGTFAGDQVEGCALGAVFADHRSPENPLRIGSVKTNIGHLEGASGMAGFIKTLLLLQHRQIPASLHFQQPHPHIPFEAFHLKVQTENEAIPETVEPPIAGVNSFGFGGTNAHIILQAYHTPVAETANIPLSQAHLLPLSAKTPQALHDLAQSYQSLLSAVDAPTLNDLCFTASRHRTHYQERLAFVTTSREDVQEQLAAFLHLTNNAHSPSQHGSSERGNAIAFVFSGNGSQWWGMGRALLQRHPLYRATIERCDQRWQPLAGWSLIEELLKDEQASRIAHTEFAQPLLFALQIALVELWKSWGITPQAVIGHSVGEIAAAYVAGILSFEDALAVVYHRSRLQEMSAGQGTMVAVGISPQQANELISSSNSDIALAAINTPQSVTLSGTEELLHQLIDPLAQQDTFCRFLKLNYAFHSAQMDPMQEELLNSLLNLKPQEARISFFSTVTGAQITGQECDASYWWHNVRLPVQFSSAIERIIANNISSFLEIGPHPVLSAYVQECLGERDGRAFASLRRGGDDLRQVLTTLGELYTQGHDVCWEQIIPQGKQVQLPNYPWQRERYWHNEAIIIGRKPNDSAVHPLLGFALPTAQLIWEQALDVPDLAYLFDHQIDGAELFPATGYIELLLAVAAQTYGTQGVTLEQMRIQAPLFLHEHQPARLQTSIDAGDVTISALHNEQEGWTVCATGHIIAPSALLSQPIDLASLHLHCPHTIAAAAFYDACHLMGFHYGPAFQLVQQIWVGNQEALGLVHWPMKTDEQSSKYHLHPALLDSCFQVLIALSLIQTNEGTGETNQRTYIPVGYDRLHLYEQPATSSPLYSHVYLTKFDKRQMVADNRIYDEAGRLLVEICGLRLQASSSMQAKIQAEGDELLYEEQWYPAPLHSTRGNLPHHKRLYEATKEQLTHICQQSPLPHFYQHVQPAIKALCTATIVCTLQQLGCDLSQDAHFSIPQQCQSLQILPRYEALLKVWCFFLMEQTILAEEEDGWRVLSQPDQQSPVKLLGEAMRLYPDHHATLLALMKPIPHLVAILRGEVDPHELLFPGQDMSLPGQLYAHDACIRLSNRLLQSSIQQVIKLLPADRHLRILEIGAGFGGTTAHILPCLSAENTTYVFTDVSEVLLQQAQRRYQSITSQDGVKFDIDYRLLDLELDPEQQGFDAHSFDLIIASHVVSSTHNLRRSLEHIRTLLAPQGLFYLAETTNPFSATNLLLFGLLDEFWSSQDHQLRPYFPTLTLSRWQEELNYCGFYSPVILTPQPETGEPEQTIFLMSNESIKPPKLAPAQSDIQQTWLLFADEQELAQELAERLAGQKLVWFKRSTAYQQLDATHFLIRPHCNDDLQKAFAALQQTGHAPSQIVYLWGLLAYQPESETLLDCVNQGCLSLLTLVQSLVTSTLTISPRLWIITSGVQDGAPITRQPQNTSEHPPQIALAPLYGLARVIVNEHPELRPTIIDISTPSQLPPYYQAEELAALAEELRSQADVSEVCLRASKRFLNRIERAPLTSILRSSELQDHPDLSFRLCLETPGMLNNLYWRSMPRRRPGPGKVAIAVVATGLNFKDVATTLGLIEPDAFEELPGEYALGLECAGTITALGDGVTGFSIGDEVIALGAGTLSPWLVVDARSVVRKPANISMQAAAGILCVFLTAYYALHKLAHIQVGERVLIHGAAGGIGLAAIQIVQQAGGTVYATAGSPEKRDYLRTLGVHHVFDSRSLAFADEIMQLTNGEGIDIVLNSVAGEVAAQSLNILRSFGRFLEIGKRDFEEHTRLGLHPFERCLAYFSIDLLRLTRELPDLTMKLMRELMEQFEQGRYTPLPYHLYQLDQAVEAFRFMQQSRHIGKIVIQVQHHHVPVTHLQIPPELCLREDGSYLITGGLGGFGLASAQFLVEHGARHLILASRRGQPEIEDMPIIEQFRQAGVQVTLACLDVTLEQEVVALLTQIKQHMPPLRGIIHSAMVLADQLVAEMDQHTWEQALNPKMLGAWHLHRHTLELPLDFFVLYSSSSAATGNSVQGNYVAGNAFLDALARYRRAHGLPALAIGWAALAQVGCVARMSVTAEYLERIGLHMVEPQEALDLLEKTLQRQRTQATVARVNWDTVTSYFSNPANNMRWRHLCSQGQEQGEMLAEKKLDLRAALYAMTQDARQEAILAHLQQLLEQIVGQTAYPNSSFDPQSSLKELGVDSLMAMEFRNSLRRSMEVDIPTMQLLRIRNLADLVAWVDQHLEETRPSDASHTGSQAQAKVQHKHALIRA